MSYESLFTAVNLALPRAYSAAFLPLGHLTGAGEPGHYSITSTEGDVVYLTLSESPPVSSSEIEELVDMDSLLKAAMRVVGCDPKTLREIIGERRQIQKQLGLLRKNLNQGKGTEARSKLNDMKRAAW